MSKHHLTSCDVSNTVWPMKKMKEPVRLTMTFEKELLDELKVISLETGAALTELVRRATADFVVRTKKRAAK